jgi:hypothetical protein
MVHFEIDDIKRAIEYQEKSCAIFKEVKIRKLRQRGFYICNLIL